MSGWIKFDKDLVSDPRVLRMAKALDRRSPTIEACNASALQGGNSGNAAALGGVTLVCGALIRLWCYADSHARDDDTLDLGLDEVDELIGITGFSRLLPPEWLVEIDGHTVKLPDFQEHNGTEAKKRALTQKRVERHRSAAKEPEKRTSVAACNAGALPDQTKTRPDQTKEISLHSQGTRAGEEADVPRGTRIEPPDEPEPERCLTEAEERERREAWLIVRAKYPDPPGRCDWIGAEHLALQAVKQGQATWRDIVEGVQRYGRFAAATGERVANPANWFRDALWCRPWTVPERAPRVPRGGLTPEAQAWASRAEVTDAPH